LKRICKAEKKKISYGGKSEIVWKDLANKTNLSLSLSASASARAKY
jgi:hypothetical protein